MEEKLEEARQEDWKKRKEEMKRQKEAPRNSLFGAPYLFGIPEAPRTSLFGAP